MRDTQEKMMNAFIEATKAIREVIDNEGKGLTSCTLGYIVRDDYERVELYVWGKVDDDDSAITICGADIGLSTYASSAERFNVKSLWELRDLAISRIRTFVENYEEACKKYREDAGTE